LDHESNVCGCSYGDVRNNRECKSATVKGTCKASFYVWSMPRPP
jgi:hypothetical protein